MAEIKVNLGEIKADYSKALKEIETIQKLSANSSQEVHAIKSSWSGDAQKNFNLKYKETTQKLSGIIIVIKGELAELKKTYQDFEQCEDDVKAMIQQISI